MTRKLPLILERVRLLFMVIAMFNKAVRGTPTVPTHMVRALNGVLKEGSRTSHTSGGCQGDTACRNSMLKSVEAKCAKDIDLPWYDTLIITLSATTNTPTVDISWFQKKSERRWIPTMRRSTLRGGRSPNSLRWETYAPPFVRNLLWFFFLFSKIYIYQSMFLLVKRVSMPRLIDYILWQMIYATALS